MILKSLMSASGPSLLSMKWLLVGLVATLCSACVAVDTKWNRPTKTAVRLHTERVSEARAELVDGFRDTLETAAANPDFDQEIVRFLQAHKSALQAYDIDAFAGFITDDFQRTTVVDQDTAKVETRAQFLNARKTWSREPPPRRNARYAIGDMEVSANGVHASVHLSISLETKYFTTRSLVQLALRRDGPDWKLTDSSWIPLHPRNALANDVTYLLVPDGKLGLPLDSFKASFDASALTQGPDRLLDEAALSSQDVLRAMRWYNLVIIFKEAPPPGAVIEPGMTYHQPTKNFTFSVRHVVREETPFFVMILRTFLHGPPKVRATLRVFIDNVPVLIEPIVTG